MAWYAKIKDVIGSSTSKRYPQWCSPSHVHLGGDYSGSSPTGTNRGPRTRKTHFDDVDLGIIDRRAMPKLLEAAIQRTDLGKVEIHGTEFIGNVERTYMIVELEQAEIASFELGAFDNDPSTDDIIVKLIFKQSRVQFFERAPML